MALASGRHGARRHSTTSSPGVATRHFKPSSFQIDEMDAKYRGELQRGFQSIFIRSETEKLCRTIKELTNLNKLPTQQLQLQIDRNKLMLPNPGSLLVIWFIVIEGSRDRNHFPYAIRDISSGLLEASFGTPVYLKPRRRQADSHWLGQRREKITTQLQRSLIISLQDL
ncbi:hypothetical protein YC2023_017347 [Brassica napus]